MVDALHEKVKAEQEARMQRAIDNLEVVRPYCCVFAFNWSICRQLYLSILLFKHMPIFFYAFFFCVHNSFLLLFQRSARIESERAKQSFEIQQEAELTLSHKFKGIVKLIFLMF